MDYREVLIQAYQNDIKNTQHAHDYAYLISRKSKSNVSLTDDYLNRKKQKEQRKIQEARKEKEALMKSIQKNVNEKLQSEPYHGDNDYGYASKESNAWYNYYIEKYQTNDDESKFKSNKSDIKMKAKKNVAETKVDTTPEDNPDKKKQDEASVQLTDKRKETSPVPSKVEEKKQGDEECKPLVEKKKTKKFAPIINFEELLKIAEKKQHEPIIIEYPVKKKERRPMTQEEKMEYEEELKRLKRKADRERKRKAEIGIKMKVEKRRAIETS